MRPSVLYEILGITVLALNVFITVEPFDVNALTGACAPISQGESGLEKIFLAIKTFHNNLHFKGDKNEKRYIH